ncbi:MAG: carbohydrate kinase [Chitinophagaceae bacterium]|nr:carbohydrate kinase [Chitinophagaceae bacterium]
MSTLKVFVVGDAMLDNYWIGHIDRISPEAPVPILSVERKESRPGGAANVALNCKALGAEVSLLTVIGQDAHGSMLEKQLMASDIQTDYILKSKNRITTCKTRIMARHQQTMRVDEETTEDLSIKDEHRFIEICLKAIQIEKPDVLIFEDYNKGVLKENVIQKIMAHCKEVGVITAVDPKKKNFLAYTGTDIFKPNLKEIREALLLSLDDVNLASLKQVHARLFKHLQHKNTFITLSEKGVFIQQDTMARMIPAHIRQISDVSGAGDTVIAVAAMLYKLTGDIVTSAHISNIAGGLVCEELGVVPISKQKLLTETIRLLAQ